MLNSSAKYISNLLSKYVTTHTICVESAFLVRLRHRELVVFLCDVTNVPALRSGDLQWQNERNQNGDRQCKRFHGQI